MNAINPTIAVTTGKSFDLNTFDVPGTSVKLRALTIGGKPWLAVPDLGAALGMHSDHVSVNVRNSCNHDEVLVIRKAETPVEVQGVFRKQSAMLSLVNESGFYRFLLRAQRSNPAAREFQDWVTKEVLPRIRRDGAYIMGEEKVATGEVSEDDLVPLIGQAMAKKFTALMDEINARNRVKDSYKAAKKTLCDSNESHRAAIAVRGQACTGSALPLTCRHVRASQVLDHRPRGVSLRAAR
ncbi:BRO-N domain-containing protein [Rhodobacter capsulatus]|uniref:BRO-N domain-containing protein n=1 Tax=Rhodobacter capsulatus TaxID=1061 RepID=UPI004024C503